VRRLLLLATAALGAWAQGTGPSYSAAGLFNAATDPQPGALAPNTMATLHGTNLSWNTASAGTIAPGNMLPTTLGGVRIWIDNSTPAALYSVSPTQINFLIPASRLPGEARIQVFRDGVVGPQVGVTIAEVAPALFQNVPFAAGGHADGSVISADSPASAGEIIVLYATGLGPTRATSDPQDDGRVVASPPDLAMIRINRFDDLSVLLNGTAIDGIQWAGLTPGFAGLYQINLQLPDAMDTNPEIRIGIGGQISPPGVLLAATP
jgi:uncharacterized protein (TIGR03437 family)